MRITLGRGARGRFLWKDPGSLRALWIPGRIHHGRSLPTLSLQLTGSRIGRRCALPAMQEPAAQASPDRVALSAPRERHLASIDKPRLRRKNSRMLRIVASSIAFTAIAATCPCFAAPANRPMLGCDGTKHPAPDGTKVPKPSAGPECGGTKEPAPAPAPAPPKS